MKSAWPKKTDPQVPDLADQPATNLASVPAGSDVRIVAFGVLPLSALQHLQSYGMLPGRMIRVLARQPLTIIQIEQTELAIEHVIASQVMVEAA